MKSYSAELEFITEKMQTAYERYARGDLGSVEQKSAFDLVTDIDKNIEAELVAAIANRFPTDVIHGEETTHDELTENRTWTIDPIDGTCNMASGVPLYGVQCALFDGGQPVAAVIYIPNLGYLMTAEKGCGCYLNGERVYVKRDGTVNNAVASFGDYPHTKNSRVAKRQHAAIAELYTQIAKIRMFGAACADFLFVAAGKTDCTVVITRNLWDIAPGILMCREAGAVVVNLDGEPYSFGDDGVIACASAELAKVFTSAFDNRFSIGGSPRKYKAVIFDFDGVIFDTEKYHYAAWNVAAKTVGAHIKPEEYIPLKSTGSDNIIDHIERRAGRKLTAAERKNIRAVKLTEYDKSIAEMSERDFLSGAFELIELLSSRAVKIGIATSASKCKDILSNFGKLDIFDCIADGTLACPKKPSPDIYVAAAKMLNVDPKDCLVIEDAISGIESGHAAGAGVIAVGGIKSDKAFACVNSLDEILDTVKFD